MYVVNFNDRVFLHILSDYVNKYYYLPCYFQRTLFTLEISVLRCALMCYP